MKQEGNSQKRKVVFWDHSFHLKTKSTDFFEEILKSEFEIIHFWDNSWRPGGDMPDVEEINRLQPYCLLFIQQLPPKQIISRIKCPNKIWVPMGDCFTFGLCVSLQSLAYCLTLNLKTIAFCRETYRLSRMFGLYTLKLQYFPAPALEHIDKVVSGKNKIFFWQRREEIDWPYLRRVISPDQVDTLYFKIDPDPGQSVRMPSAEDISAYNIKFIEGWMDKDGYLKLLKSCDVFIAPRPYEGIGRAFLEAMAFGLCVLSPNHHVANEYIRSGDNGILYDFINPQAVDLSQAKMLGARAQDSIRRGFKKWEEEKTKILKFVLRPIPFFCRIHSFVSIGGFMLIFFILRIFRYIKRNVSAQKNVI